MSRISIVIPAYNESGNIGDLVVETFRVVPEEMIGEVIVVDDASTDTTGNEVEALMAEYPKLRFIRHTRKAGQSQAIYSGVDASRFELIATMDGDGQNPPENIVRLVQAWSEHGPHLVGGHRTKRCDRFSKRLASRAANAVRRLLLRDDCPDTGCGLKVFARQEYLMLPFFHGQHRYLPALMRAQDRTVAFLSVTDRPRRHGVSKYTNLNRALVGISDLLGVAWLIRRSRPTRIIEISRS